MKANYTSLKLALGAGLCVAAASAHAVIAFDYPAGLTASPNLPVNKDRALGSVFSVGSGGIQVSALGVYDNPLNGVGTFGGTISVAIYQVTLNESQMVGGNLVVNPVDFSSASPGAILAGSQTALKTISPVYLGAGTYMIVANHYGTAAGTEAYYDRGLGGASGFQPSANPHGAFITYGDDYIESNVAGWGASLPGSWSVMNDSFVPRWTGGNFEFSAVPEASHFALAGVGLLGLVYFGRCAYQRRQTA